MNQNGPARIDFQDTVNHAWAGTFTGRAGAVYAHKPNADPQKECMDRFRPERVHREAW